MIERKGILGEVERTAVVFGSPRAAREIVRRLLLAISVVSLVLIRLQD
jgi:hypothetical protein